MGYIEALLQNCECIQKSGFRHCESSCMFCIWIVQVKYMMTAWESFHWSDFALPLWETAPALALSVAARRAANNAPLWAAWIKVSRAWKLNFVPTKTSACQLWFEGRTQTLPRNAPPPLHRGSLQFQPASLCTLLSVFLLCAREKGLICSQHAERAVSRQWPRHAFPRTPLHPSDLRILKANQIRRWRGKIQ